MKHFKTTALSALCLLGLNQAQAQDDLVDPATDNANVLMGSYDTGVTIKSRYRCQSITPLRDLRHGFNLINKGLGFTFIDDKSDETDFTHIRIGNMTTFRNAIEFKYEKQKNHNKKYDVFFGGIMQKQTTIRTLATKDYNNKLLRVDQSTEDQNRFGAYVGGSYYPWAKRWVKKNFIFNASTFVRGTAHFEPTPSRTASFENIDHSIPLELKNVYGFNASGSVGVTGAANWHMGKGVVLGFAVNAETGGFLKGSSLKGKTFFANVIPSIGISIPTEAFNKKSTQFNHQPVLTP